ncbi:MAG: YeaH/YhbH family protein [Pseudomonadota bacterium]
MFQLIIDRRLNGKNKSAVNRERFLRRYKAQVKEAVARAVKGRSITDMENGESVSIPVKDISEPTIGHGRGGVWESVHPGNEQYTKGDLIDRPKGGGGGGSGKGKASNQGEGEDDFVFELSREEFMQYFFEDLELPNLVKTYLAPTHEMKTVRAGFTSEGTPTNIHVVRSMKGAIARRIALASPLVQELKRLQEELERIRLDPADRSEEIRRLEEEIHHLRGRILRIPYLDPFDLRYINRVKQPRPTNQAVMFCLMDVSGSMDESRKDMAKRFFILLYLFLTRVYEKIEVVFVRHHTQASEVDEEEFFHSRESGGTVVSSALKLMLEIIEKRYPTNEWNIYAAQASDGENWDDDSSICSDLLIDKIMPLLQYYAYIEITDAPEQNLWHEYTRVKEYHRFFAMQRIKSPADIYPVFRELFKKQQHSHAA